MISDLSFNLGPVLFIPLALLFFLFLFRALLRNEWAAAVAWVLFLSVFFSVGSDYVPVALVKNLILNVVTVVLLRRLGLLWLVVSFVFFGLFDEFP